MKINERDHYAKIKRQFSQAELSASIYKENSPSTHFYNIRIRRVIEFLDDLPGGRVLDAGCGPSTIAGFLPPRRLTYCGLDISEQMIRKSVSRFPDNGKYRYAVGKIEELPFQDAFFDAVLCLGVLEYVPRIDVAVAEIVRVAKVGGILILSMLNWLSPYRLWEHYVYPKIRRTSNLLNLFTPKHLVRLLKSVGLQIEDIVYYDFNLFLPPFDSRYPRLSIPVADHLESLGRSRLKFIGTAFIVKARKRKR